MRFYLALLILPLITLTSGRQVEDDKKVLKNIFDEVLTNGECYDHLHDLCKDIGGRLSGSPEAAKAVEWGKKVMEDYGFDKVYLQEITVPHWVRGNNEGAELLLEKKGKVENLGALNICALGHSVGTEGKWLEAEVIEVQGLEELEKLGRDKIEGKIVFYNRPMNPRNVNTFKSYGGCVDQRSRGASEAGQFGAVATICRSMNLRQDDHPHTGVMMYKDGIDKIPAAAISTNDADKLSEAIKQNSDAQTTKVRIKLSCEMLPDEKSFNVIGEITGSKYPEKVIVFGGHLDSWDNGEGAHDDGVGVVQSIEVLRIFKALKMKPKHTIRAVLFMNEENGNNGGKGYAKVAKDNGEVHLAAIESDRGGFSPRGFSIDADDAKVKYISKWRKILEPYGLHFFEKGYGGVDIGPLKEQDVPLVGLVPDSQRYFDYHHSADDVFENVNKRELELGAGSMAALVYLIDKYAFVE